MDAETCTAKIRPFRPVNDTELTCERISVGHFGHRAVLRDYAWPGSATVVTWSEVDRRNFRGEFERCPEGCILPNGHQGEHAV